MTHPDFDLYTSLWNRLHTLSGGVKVHHLMTEPHQVLWSDLKSEFLLLLYAAFWQLVTIKNLAKFKDRGIYGFSGRF